MFESIRQYFRDNPRMWWVTAGAVLTAAIVVWFVFGGLVPEIGRFFASDELEDDGGDYTDPPPDAPGDQCVVPEASWTCGDGDCDDDGAPNPAGPAAHPLSACNDGDDANRCIGSGIAQSACQQPGTPTPGPNDTPTPTTGGPTPTSTNNPGGPTPDPRYPSTFPDCFVIEEKGSSDPNWGTTTEHTIPTILRDRPGAQLFYKASVINNCPWRVHWEVLADGSARASFDTGVGRRERSIDSEFSRAFTEDTPYGRDVPSCWNSGPSRPADCARDIFLQYNFNTYTCGSLGISMTWKQFPNGSSTTDPRGISLSSALNYGRDCSGSPAERGPGRLSSIPTTTPVGTPSSVPPVTLSVSCGTSQNVLTWTALPAGSTGSSIVKNTDGADGVYLVQGLPITARTYTDTNVQPGHRYSYTFKNSPTNRSNTVTCLNGVITTSTPAPSLPPPGQPLTCQPQTQTIIAGQTARVDAGGGAGAFVWSGSGGAIQQDLGSTFVIYRWTVAGTKVVQAQSAGQSASCLVSVIDPTATNTAEPSVPFQTYNPTASPTSTNIATIPTGPGDVIILALAAAASLTLLYAAYTRSSSFAQREIERASKEHDPLDFRP